MRIIVIRHAKSSWDDIHLSDHERPLSSRGRKASDLIGRWLVDNSYIPQVVLSSTSERTRETWSRIETFMPNPCQMHYVSNLYHGYSDSIVQALTSTRSAPALVLGHNPGIGNFARSIVKQQPHHPKFLQFPTAATLVCDCPIDDWSDIELGTGILVDFVVPRDLESSMQK